jgi:hypothetical protein
MRLEEPFPIFGGLSLGCITRVLFSRNRRGAVILVAALIAISATVTSGEFSTKLGISSRRPFSRCDIKCHWLFRNFGSILPHFEARVLTPSATAHRRTPLVK